MAERRRLRENGGPEGNPVRHRICALATRRTEKLRVSCAPKVMTVSCPSWPEEPSEICASLRDLQRACALDKVRKRLGVGRTSLGSLSESVAIFDPAPLKEIAVERGHTITSRPNPRFAAVGQRITAVDGTVIETVKRVAELSWTPKTKGRHLSAYRLHTHFEVLTGKAVRIDATSANPGGEADERAVLQRTIEADRCYVLDRGYISYGLWNAINAAGSSYVCRSSDRTLATVRHVNQLTEADRDASVISDEIVDLGWKAKHRTRPDHPVRLICVAVKPHESYRGRQGPHCDGVLRLVTNRLDLPAELIAEIWKRSSKHEGSPRRRSHGLIGTRGSMLRSPSMNSARGCPCPGSRRRWSSEARMAKREQRRVTRRAGCP